MTVNRLLGDLGASGTGKDKLDVAQQELSDYAVELRTHPDKIDVERFVERLQFKSLWPEGTVTKAKEFVNQYLGE